MVSAASVSQFCFLFCALPRAGVKSKNRWETRGKSFEGPGVASFLIPLHLLLIFHTERSSDEGEDGGRCPPDELHSASPAYRGRDSHSRQDAVGLVVFVKEWKKYIFLKM